MNSLYRTRYGRILNINGKLVNKVEVFQHNSRVIVFKTDYPVETLSMDQEEFFRKFEKW